jgi:uncharacterized membrane protein YsdA (DUF1294 family)
MTEALARVVIYALVINLITFGAFWADKRAAIRRQWRTPEARLLTLAALGGWVGALAGQHLLRHKTRKEPFRTILWSIIVFEAAALVGWVLLFR